MEFLHQNERERMEEGGEEERGTVCIIYSFNRENESCCRDRERTRTKALKEETSLLTA